MARRSKNKDNMKTIAIAASIALLVVLVFNGGAITGKATQAFDVTATVSASLGCTINDSTLALGTISANAESGTQTFTIENTGTGNIDISFQADTDPDTDFGSSTGSAIEIKHVNDGAGNGTISDADINLTDTTKTAMLVGTSSADGSDEEDFTVAVFPAAETTVVATEITLDITAHCE